MEQDQVYLRRVRDPEPLMLQLAATAVDSFKGVRPRPALLAAVSRETGVPLAYLLDEIERRARQ